MSAEGTALTFKYDHNGLRTQKVVEASWYPETTNYYLHGKLLTHMTVDYTDFDEVAHQDKLHFFYDESSRPAQVNFNGINYTYVHNLQGDIVGLLDSAGNLVVEYKYDAWGKPISTTGNLADTLGKRNPFRYRGYIYDAETGLYYIESRFYAPDLCRFVNADDEIDTKNTSININLFSYCYNNPTIFIDSDGHAPATALRVGSSQLAMFLAWATATVGKANFWNPLGWILLGVIAIGAITWAAMSMYKTYSNTVAKADKKIKSTVKRRSKTRYWKAIVKRGYVVLGKPLTFSQAVKEVAAGRSVFAVTKVEAKAVALLAGGTTGRNNKYLTPEIDAGKAHTPGYYWHYHTYNRRGGHVYYLF